MATVRLDDCCLDGSTGWYKDKGASFHAVLLSTPVPETTPRCSGGQDSYWGSRTWSRWVEVVLVCHVECVHHKCMPDILRSNLICTCSDKSHYNGSQRNRNYGKIPFHIRTSCVGIPTPLAEASCQADTAATVWVRFKNLTEDKLQYL